MRAAVVLCVTMLAAHPAAALESCFADSVGAWRGPVLNAGRIEQVDTVFSLDADGRLSASYHIDDAAPLDGTLDAFTPDGLCEAMFTWRDQAGTGVVTIRFDPAHGRFRGVWGAMQPVPGNVFDGDRLPPNA